VAVETGAFAVSFPSTAKPVLTPAQRKWPDVPACYGWLSLDRRGNWRLQGERVSHPGLIAFLSQHYSADSQGRWFVQNGPQQVFVGLEYTPWVFRMETAGLLTHTGRAVDDVRSVLVDECGNVLLDSALGIGLLDDRDLPAFLAACTDARGAAPDEATLLALIAGESVAVFWQELPLQQIAAVDVPIRYKFIPQPSA
jgi:hypothetical protein